MRCQTLSVAASSRSGKGGTHCSGGGSHRRGDISRRSHGSGSGSSNGDRLSCLVALVVATAAAAAVVAATAATAAAEVAAKQDQHTAAALKWEWQVSLEVHLDGDPFVTSSCLC